MTDTASSPEKQAPSGWIMLTQADGETAVIRTEAIEMVGTVYGGCVVFLRNARIEVRQSQDLVLELMGLLE